MCGVLALFCIIWSPEVKKYLYIHAKLYTLEFPFHNSDHTATINNILTANLEYPKYLSKSVIDLMSKIFVPQPKNRYTIEQIKEHPWFATYKL
jgi:serine/threonine protein kinase